MMNDSRRRRPEAATPYQIRLQRAKAVRKDLTRLARKYPEFAHLIEDPMVVLEHQTNRARVLHAIHTGAWTVEALTTETKLSKPKVQTVLDALVATQIVFTRLVKETKNPNGGRPQLLYLPNPNTNP